MNWENCQPLPTNEAIDQYLFNLFANARPVQPTCIVTVGAPGSGKSFAQKDCIKQLKMKLSDFIVLDKDDIYNKLFQMNNACYYVPADKIGIEYVNNRNISYAVEHGYNMIIDGTGKDFQKTYKENIQRFKNAGYRVILCITYLDISVGLGRVKERERQTGRKVTSKYLESTYKVMKDVIPKYLDVSDEDVDAIFVYDNEVRLGLMFERFDDEYKCFLPQKVEEFFPDRYRNICK
jgi:predicted ABC-type ATPase